jgi:hypothetical protein
MRKNRQRAARWQVRVGWQQAGAPPQEACESAAAAVLKARQMSAQDHLPIYFRAAETFR